MSRIDSNAGALSGSGNQPGGMAGLDPDDFMKLLIAELQNQDPMEPMKNAEMMEQIGQIREIAATDQLTKTLEGISDGQNIATASSMVGQQVQAMNEDGDVVFGVVRSVQIVPDDEGRKLQLKVDTGETIVDLKMEDIFHILPGSNAPPVEFPDEVPEDVEDVTPPDEDTVPSEDADPSDNDDDPEIP